MDLVLEKTIDNFQELKNNSDIPDENISLNIENKKEFLNNLQYTKSILKRRNKPFHFQQRTCPKCDFKSESRIILDQHLTQPHYYRTVYICNFCNDMKSNSKEEYRSHVFHVHGRCATIEKPPSNFMCPICDFESGKLIFEQLRVILCKSRPSLKIVNKKLEQGYFRPYFWNLGSKISQ